MAKPEDVSTGIEEPLSEDPEEDPSSLLGLGIFQPKQGTRRFPKLQPFVYNAIDWLFSLVTTAAWLIFTEFGTGAWCSWAAILGFHYCLMIVTDYGPDDLSPPMAWVNIKLVPLAVMYTVDWVIVCNYLFGCQWGGCADIGVYLFPVTGVAGCFALLLLDPTPYRSGGVFGAGGISQFVHQTQIRKML